MFSVWDQNNTLISAKLLGKTAKAADGNGLAEGALSKPFTTIAKTDLQSPMPNAAFFENFQDTPPGNLNYNYFDVRTSDHGIDPDLTDRDEYLVFANERHFHTQVIGGEGSRAIFVRPRVPFDFTKRTGTMQFEVIISKDLISTDPIVKTGTTYLYSLGSAAPVTYNASVISGGTSWLKITSPTTGTLTSPALGGRVIPLNFSVDFSKPDCCTRADGNIGVIKITGGVMPQYVAVIADSYGLDHYLSILNSFPAMTTFHKDAIIGYHGN